MRSSGFYGFYVAPQHLWLNFRATESFCKFIPFDFATDNNSKPINFATQINGLSCRSAIKMNHSKTDKKVAFLMNHPSMCH